jgi:hypothetical protein
LTASLAEHVTTEVPLGKEALDFSASDVAEMVR